MKECHCPKVECANSRVYLGSTWLKRKKPVKVTAGPPVFDEATYHRALQELNVSND
jgi:hypothetical protein